MPRSFGSSEFVQQKSWHGSVCSTVVLLLHGCLFKPSRMLPRRDCHAWANLRTQNQISLCGKLLVVCQERLCSVYLNNQANQAWPPPLQWKARICRRALLVSVFVIQSRNSVIQIDRRDEECNMSSKWGAQNPFQLSNCFSSKLSQFLVGVSGAQAAQRGKVSSGAAVRAEWCAGQLRGSLLHVDSWHDCHLSAGSAWRTLSGLLKDTSARTSPTG